MVKNCSHCGTTNLADATTCMVCDHTTFFADHQAASDVDGIVVHDTSATPPPVIVIIDGHEA